MTENLWGERFWSRIINGIEDFLRIVEYIDNNPVAAGLVKEAKDWEFGGLFHHIMRCIDIVLPPDKTILERYSYHWGVVNVCETTTFLETDTLS